MTDHSQLVKTLEWRRFDRNRELAETSFGSYLTDGLKGTYTVEFRGVLFNGAPHKTLDAAKEAAQADYTTRILSALNHDVIDALQARVAELEADNQRLTTNLHRFPALMESIEQQKNEPLSSREAEIIEAIRSLPESFAEYQWKADERPMFGEKYIRDVAGDNGKGMGRQWIATTPSHIDGLARYIAAANPDTVAMLLRELHDARALLERKPS